MIMGRIRYGVEETRLVDQ